MSQSEANPNVVQQLMFNRILAYVRLLSVDHVNVTGFDTKTGSIEGSLAGVSFIVNVALGAKRDPPSPSRSP
jgi:hypothetical protein